MKCLIAYDIFDPRRVQKVHRYLLQYCQPLQKSVMLFDGTDSAFAQCLAGLKNRLDTRVDDVQIYRISQAQQLQFFGKPRQLDGIWLSQHD